MHKTGLRCVLLLMHLQVVPKPEPSNDNLVINELIREYLVFNNYRETLSVFLPGQKNACV